jgi:hypothetical protein
VGFPRYQSQVQYGGQHRSAAHHISSPLLAKYSSVASHSNSVFVFVVYPSRESVERHDTTRHNTRRGHAGWAVCVAEITKLASPYFSVAMIWDPELCMYHAYIQYSTKVSTGAPITPAKRIEQPAPIMDPFPSSISSFLCTSVFLINKMGPDPPPHVPCSMFPLD